MSLCEILILYKLSSLEHEIASLSWRQIPATEEMYPQHKDPSCVKNRTNASDSVEIEIVLISAHLRHNDSHERGCVVI